MVSLRHASIGLLSSNAGFCRGGPLSGDQYRLRIPTVIARYGLSDSHGRPQHSEANIGRKHACHYAHRQRKASNNKPLYQAYSSRTKPTQTVNEIGATSNVQSSSI
jgi:hypothetical protein